MNATDQLLECSFRIPLRRTDQSSDGALHPQKTWDWLINELTDRFGRAILAPGVYQVSFTNIDSGERVIEEARQYLTVVVESRLRELRRLLAEACMVFRQESVYLSVAGEIEFVANPER